MPLVVTDGLLKSALAMQALRLSVSTEDVVPTSHGDSTLAIVGVLDLIGHNTVGQLLADFDLVAANTNVDLDDLYSAKP
jgi:hypothetical protein